MKVGVYEAKSKLSKMIELALDGEEVVITRNGEDAVKLVPVPRKKNWIGMWDGQVEVKDGFFDAIDDETVKYLTGEIQSKFPDENID
jgi:prevent-host-death family protein